MVLVQAIPQRFLPVWAKHVTSMDVFPDFTQQAQARLQQLDLQNVMFATSNGLGGWPSGGPYDVIVITGSLLALPQAFAQQLAPGGSVICYLGAGAGNAGWDFYFSESRSVADG